LFWGCVGVVLWLSCGFYNRNSFSENVINSTREDLENMGVELLSYVVSDIHSENKTDILDQEN
jgi:uncharacterized membrane protein YqiK